MIPHLPVKYSARDQGGFATVFSKIDKYIYGDLIFANLETTIIPAEKNFYQNLPWPGSFFAQPELHLQLSALGFNVFNIANNHILDYENYGLRHSLRSLLPAKSNAKWIVIGYQDHPFHLPGKSIERKGIRIGIIGFTTTMNLLHKLKKVFPVVNYIQGTEDLKKMRLSVRKLRQENDYVIVSMHWGTEYQREIEKLNQTIVRLLHKEGVDLILGHHPHVLRRVQMLRSQKGRKETLVIHSMGNFLSNQGADGSGMKKNVRQGAIFYIKPYFLHSNAGYHLVKTDWNYLPIWTRNEAMSWEKPDLLYLGKERMRIQPLPLLCEINKSYAKLEKSDRKEFKRRFYLKNKLNLLLKNYHNVVQILGKKALLIPLCSK